MNLMIRSFTGYEPNKPVMSCSVSDAAKIACIEKMSKDLERVDFENLNNHIND